MVCAREDSPKGSAYGTIRRCCSGGEQGRAKVPTVTGVSDRRKPARRPTRDDPVSLNFVMAPSFHSSTLLALLLNNHPDISCLGDTLPHRRLFPNQRCGCLQKVRDCPFWQDVSLGLDADRFVDSDHMIPAYPQVVKHWRVNPYLARGLAAASLALGPWVWNAVPRASREFLDTFLRFSEIVCEMQGTRIFVNNVKSFTSLLSLRSMLVDRAEIRILHLIRDPRGYHFSEKKSYPDITPAVSARHWRDYHSRVEWLRRYTVPDGYLRVRYEDLCADGEGTMAKICNFFGAEPHRVCGPVAFPEKNHVLGNTSRLAFDGTIRQSLAWQEALSAEDEKTLLSATRPLSEMCGYG